MDNKTINKAAYKQAALQIAAGMRRLERADKFLTNQNWNAEETTEEELKEIFENLKRPGGEYCNGCNALFYATLAIGSYNACLRFGNQHLKLCKTSDGEVRLLKCEQCRKESK